MAELARIDLTGDALGPVLDRVARAATDLLPSTAGASVILWDPQAEEFTLASSTVQGQDGRQAAERVRRRGGATRWIVENAAPLFVNDVEDDRFGTSSLAVEFGIRSYAGVPIVAEGEVLGVLYTLGTDPRHYDSDDRSFLNLLAVRAAHAIVTARLLVEARAAREHSEALAWVANALIAADDLGDVLRSVVEGVAAALDADRVRLVVVDAESGKVVDVVDGGLNPEEVPQIDAHTVTGLARWAIDHARPAVSQGGDDDQPDARRSPSEQGLGPLVVAPLRFGRAVLGSMTVGRDLGRRVFSDAEVDLVIAMSGQAAVAIENVRLLEATRRSLHDTEALYEASQRLASAGGRDEVLAAAAAGAAVLLPAERVVIHVVDPDTGALVEGTRAGSDPGVSGSRLRPNPAAVDALRTGRGVRRPGAGSGEPPMVVCPIRIQQRTLGVVTATNPGGREFSNRQLELLMTLGAHAASAIDRALLFEQVQRLAITDELTEVHNRRHLFDLAEMEFRQAMRYRRALTAIMFDIDRFKDINDTYGHAVGDEILRWFAAQCRRVVREVDVLGRYGGEEFAMLLPETDLKAALEIAERVRSEVAAAPVPTSRGPVPVTISAGVADLADDTPDVHTLVDRADIAMYAAKRAGRNRVEAG